MALSNFNRIALFIDFCDELSGVPVNSKPRFEADEVTGWHGIASCYATASSPLRWMIESSLSAGPPGRFFPRSQSDTRFFDTLR